MKQWMIDIQKLEGIDLRFDEPMASHISFRLGGNAEAFAIPKTVEELGELLQFSRENQVKTTILGAGSNVLVADSGVEGLVISTHRGLTNLVQTGDTTIIAQSGVTMAKLATFARDLGLSGLEFAHGIPGTVGGGIFMNAGAYGGEMVQVAMATKVMYMNGTMETFAGEAQELSYRHSGFQDKNCVILETEFSLIPGDKEGISNKMAEFSQKRRMSQPLEYPSGGSTFKRPVGGYAAALIDQAGLKGLTVGGACVSEKHSGFVINKGGATCRDVLELMEAVQAQVKAHSGVDLESELRVL
ncbi:MAG: UDP-N-acetylmuramate dehydrogenase [Eubacteriales bacterium]